jgi:hypothetical protein
VNWETLEKGKRIESAREEREIERKKNREINEKRMVEGKGKGQKRLTRWKGNGLGDREKNNNNNPGKLREDYGREFQRPDNSNNLVQGIRCVKSISIEPVIYVGLLTAGLRRTIAGGA